MPPSVFIRNLRKSYGRVKAVRGVSFEVRKGEVFGLLGPNGAGKTTTIECILGLRQPDSGEVRICGLDSFRRPREVRQRIGAALQTMALQDKITPREALRLFGAFYRTGHQPDALLRRFDLLDKARSAFGTLSGGQRQRLALALAFQNDPDVIFLDEPTAGLDPSTRIRLRSYVRQMSNEGHSVLLTTHYMEEAEQLCDRIAIMNHGRILALDSPLALIEQSSVMPTICLQAAQRIDPGMLEQISDVQDIACKGNSARFRAKSINQALAELVALLDSERVDIAALVVEKPGLEEVFVELTSGSQTPKVMSDTP